MAKVASSKTNPGRKRGAVARKQYNGKDVEVVLYISRHGSKNTKYRAARYVGGEIIEDASGEPISWDSIK